MPEGPEVRRFADAVSEVLQGRLIQQLTARTLNARKWLAENHDRLIGQRVKRVFSHGKHLIGLIDDNFYFHSHLMMWGRWQTFVPAAPTEIDRRERARIIVNGGAAILHSAPIFNVGEGDPYQQIEHLGTLGPDVLPYCQDFDRIEFRRRLLSKENVDVEIGAALLNQTIVAGLGNYLRAEILFSCGINPWRKVAELNERELTCIEDTASDLAGRSYLNDGATATDDERMRMRSEAALVYQPGREMGTRHLVFRRTNLPCLRCGEAIRQERQVTHGTGDDERARIIYFCPNCQSVEAALKKRRNG